MYNNAEIGIYAVYGRATCRATRSIPIRWGSKGSTYYVRRHHCQQSGVRQQQPGDSGRQNSSTYTDAITNNTVYQSVGDAIKLQNSPNVRLRNNILWVNAGYDLNIDSASQVGFDSDYNDLSTTLPGKLALWGSHEFTSWVDWFYELGQDGHSQTSDPQFIDPDGADDVLGFSTLAAGPAQYLDNGQAGFSTTGTWTSQNGGYGSSSLKSVAGSGAQATWTFSGLTPGQFYQVAATWPATSGTYYAQYQVYDGNSLASTTSNVNQTLRAPSDFTDAGVSWKSLPMIYVTSGTVVVTLTSTYSGYPVVADAVRLQAVVGHGGTDDNFHVSSGSPTIDAGDPASYYLSEPVPNGGRINLGYDGNTPQAALSAAQAVQVLSPNGLEKFEVGQPVTIQWRTSGIDGTSNGGADQRRQHDRRGQLAAQRLPDDRLLQRVPSATPWTPAAWRVLRRQAVYQTYSYAAIWCGQQAGLCAAGARRDVHDPAALCRAELYQHQPAEVRREAQRVGGAERLRRLCGGRGAVQGHGVELRRDGLRRQRHPAGTGERDGRRRDPVGHRVDLGQCRWRARADGQPGRLDRQWQFVDTGGHGPGDGRQRPGELRLDRRARDGRQHGAGAGASQRWHATAGHLRSGLLDCQRWRRLLRGGDRRQRAQRQEPGRSPWPACRPSWPPIT